MVLYHTPFFLLRRFFMLVNQEIKILDRKTGKIGLRNTIDCSAAIEAAKEASENGGRSTSDTVMPLGFIPNEMWNFNPWLIEANKARNEGDMVNYHKNIMKFFQLFPQFAVLHQPKYFTTK